MNRHLSLVAQFLVGIALTGLGAILISAQQFDRVLLPVWQLIAASALLCLGIVILARISIQSRQKSMASKRGWLAGKIIAACGFAIAALGGISLNWPWWIVGIYFLGVLLNAAGAWREFRQSEGLRF